MILAIIDDCDITRFVHAKLVKHLELDIDVIKYNCGRKFLDDLKDQKIDLPDIVLTDYNMKVMNGVGLINELDSYRSKNRIENKLFSYIITANKDISTITNDCKNETFQGFIMKPLRTDHLSDIFEKSGFNVLQKAI
ncbi:response regulator [Psychroflexus planctonicus]|nr:response regulator [Psychroflexus planctonicus]